MPRRIYGYEVRDPYASEIDFFQKNPTTAGMAAEDGRIITNPFTPLSSGEIEAVMRNEAARLWLRENNVTPQGNGWQYRRLALLDVCG